MNSPLSYIAVGVDTHSQRDLNTFYDHYASLVDQIAHVINTGRGVCAACRCEPLTTDTRFTSYGRGLLALQLAYSNRIRVVGFAVCQSCVLAYGSVEAMTDAVGAGMFELVSGELLADPAPTPRAEKAAREAVTTMWERLGVSQTSDRPRRQSP